jgi:DNA polymerase I
MRQFISDHSQDGSRVHASWNQTNVRTGRLSCSKPNLQNIPNEREVRGIVINPRSIFCASAGSLLISADYSQIEMRILAHVCGDQSMRNLFLQSGDIYMLLAGLIFDKAQETVTKTERERAKTICLGLPLSSYLSIDSAPGVMYGMGLQAVATKLSIDPSTASSIMNAFYRKFGTVRDWIQSTKL